MNLNNVIEAQLGKMCGIMTLTVKDAEGHRVEEKCTGPFKNLITTFGLDNMMGSSGTKDAVASSTYCGVGSSNTTPQFTDVNLGSALGTRTNTVTNVLNVNSGSPEYYHSYTRTYNFTQGQVVGNVAEICTFDQSSGANAFSRALVKDISGTPTTITLLSTETLYVTYELRYYPTLTDTTGTVVISGTSYSYTQRAKGVGATSSILQGSGAGVFYPAYFAQYGFETATLAALGVQPSGANSLFSTFTLNSYSSGSFTRTATITAIANDTNFTTGIGIVSWGSAGNGNHGFYTSFSPKIPKLTSESNKTLTLTLSLTIGRL